VELPDRIRDVAQLDDLLSEPSREAIEALRRNPGDVIVLGAGGKMGPTLARMARRAMDAAGQRFRVIAVARFSSSDLRSVLESQGVETIQCDLLREEQVESLPDAPNVIFMAGRKFGSTGDEPLTWAMNTHLPAIVCRRFRRSRIVAFSTGNVYGLTAHGRGGSREEDAPAPVGEYAMSCLGRERLFQYFSRANEIPIVILRLNYAVEMRYGVLVDLASRISRGEPIDLSMGHVNVIWQGDANAMALAALAHASSPAVVLNVAGPEELSVRALSTNLAAAMAMMARFTGSEAGDALLSSGARGYELLGRPRVDLTRMLAWTADWVQRGGESLGKPTHFESRAGQF
jgi:nucleoside-diphosphate-sugar epimerase